MTVIANHLVPYLQQWEASFTEKDKDESSSCIPPSILCFKV
jgi:hypothetical protein